MVDQEGLPLPGATVMEKGTNNGVSTDFDGNFTITVSSETAILEISFLGFQSKEIPASDPGISEITLTEDENALSEVVVTALGIKREEKSLGFPRRQ